MSKPQVCQTTRYAGYPSVGFLGPTVRAAERLALLSSLEGDSQIGVPISAPKRALWIEQAKYAVARAKECVAAGDHRGAAKWLDDARWRRRAIADAPVMCAIGDGRVIQGAMGQHPPQVWRDMYTIETGPPARAAALEALQHVR